jgi:hypothetical protein
MNLGENEIQKAWMDFVDILQILDILINQSNL